VGPVSGMYWIQNVSAIEWHDRRDACLPRAHVVVAHAKILHSMSAHEMGGRGWVDGLHLDRSTCNPSLKLLAHGTSRWRTWWAAGRTQRCSAHRHSTRPVCFSGGCVARYSPAVTSSRLVRLGRLGGDGPA
jgi:hypothetical protein